VIPASFRLAQARLRSTLHRSSVAFAVNRRRLRWAAAGGVSSGVIHAVAPKDGALLAALSYDDGPSPANTLRLLELLERYEARATFFVVGAEVEKHPELARAVVDAGHELGNHSFDHANPLTLEEDELRADFNRAAVAIERATGRRPALLRPPYGKRAPELAALHRPDGVATVLWSIDSGDTRGTSVDVVTHEVTENIEAGDVVLMHDGGDARPITLAATERVLEELTVRGYRFVTISELLVAAR
jgi:peptidoglycan-N-acetylglucosamine deacetylase